MPGGLLNLVSYGNMNVILNGNPSKTFFKTTYSKYTNFGLQKFRIDFDGLRTLKLTEDSHFSFKIPRYADLLMDTYFVITLPTIWSPILNFTGPNLHNFPNANSGPYKVWPYEFKWIENLGSQIIRKVRYMIGGQVIQEFTGHYLYNMVQRDFSEGKKKLFDEMTGNVDELNDPANYGGRNGNYPNAIYNKDWLPGGPEPSIRSRTLYIPLNIWSTLSSKLAIPLVSLQYNFLHIEIDCRPIQELFVVRNIPTLPLLDKYSKRWRQLHYFNRNVVDKETFNDDMQEIDSIGTYIQGNQNEEKYRFFRFLHPPPETLRSDLSLNGHITGEKDQDLYPSTSTNWYADIHLISTYAFLGEEEVKNFALKPQYYLIKEIHEQTHYNVTGNNRLNLNSTGLLSSWMWFFQRSDVALRNDWCNYTNWKGKDVPFKTISNLFFAGNNLNLGENFNNIESMYDYSNKTITSQYYPPNIFNTRYNNYFNWAIMSSQGDVSNGVTYNNLDEYLFSLNNYLNFNDTCNNALPNGKLTTLPLVLPNPFQVTGPFHVSNQKEIMQSWGLLLDGKVRENTFSSGINNYIEKYVRTAGNAKDGLYCYNFCLTTDPFQYQPSGAINLNKFNHIEFEFTTHTPPHDPEAKTYTICDSSGDIIGINKPVWNIYKYNYNLYIMEERYNILTFTSGTANLSYAR